MAHWKLDETSGTTAVDSVGGHDGTLINFSGSTWGSGQLDGALDFDGTNDYINVPHDPTLNLASALTISTWFRADSFGVGIGGYRTFVSKYPNATTANYWFGTWKQELVFGFWSGGVWQEVFPTGLGLSTGQWYQAAVTFDDVSNQVLLYLDGTLVHTGVMTLTPPVNTGAVTIGRSAAGEYWDGQLDDVRIYDKVLTGADIAALASGGGGGGSGPPPGGGVIFEEYTQASLASNGTSMSINKPGGTAVGDLLIATLVTDGEQKNAMTLSGGWTLIDHGVESKQVSMDVWWKLAGSSEPAQYAFGWAKSQEAYGWIMRFTGHDPGNPINASANTGGSSAAPTSPSVNTTVANAMILRIGGFDDDDITVGDPGLTGHTAITMNRSDSGTGTTSGGAGYLIKAATGASGTSNFALTASENYRAVTIGIAPAP